MTDNTDNNSTDDAEKMRLAFEQFMLTGGKNNNNNNNSQAKKSNEEASTPQSTSNKSKKKKKKKRQSTGATPTKAVATLPVSATKQKQPPSLQSQPQHSTTRNPKVKKRYYQLLRSYNDKVKHTWMDIDNQLLSVLQNIGSIRGRLPHEWKVLSQMTRYHHVDEEEVDEGPEQEEKVFDNNGDWKSHGHQEISKTSSQYYYTHHLHLQDVQLALSHDLEQHEKMLIGVRSLMSNLAECHDALGRIVDSLWQFHFEVVGDDGTIDGEEMMKDNDSLEDIVNCVTESYQMLSMELYKKQNIVAMVIESTKDEIFGVNELGKEHNDVGTKSQALVRECCKSWKRSPSDEEALLNVMKLGES